MVASGEALDHGHTLFHPTAGHVTAPADHTYAAPGTSSDDQQCPQRLAPSGVMPDKRVLVRRVGGNVLIWNSMLMAGSIRSW